MFPGTGALVPLFFAVARFQTELRSRDCRSFLGLATYVGFLAVGFLCESRLSLFFCRRLGYLNNEHALH